MWTAFNYYGGGGYRACKLTPFFGFLRTKINMIEIAHSMIPYEDQET
jgi:hypothetical protein